jgi:uncharacterized coiled-coil DUF342 family protein
MNLEQIKNKWNSEADEYNKWDSLGLDEQVEYAYLLGELVVKEKDREIARLTDELATTQKARDQYRKANEYHVECLAATNNKLDVCIEELSIAQEKLREVDTLYKAGTDYWNPVFKKVLDRTEKTEVALTAAQARMEELIAVINHAYSNLGWLKPSDFKSPEANKIAEEVYYALENSVIKASTTSPITAARQKV